MRMLAAQPRPTQERERVIGPTWLADVLASVMTVTALYCSIRILLARLLRRQTEPDVDLVHVAMGGGMAYLLLRVPGTQLTRWGVIGFALAAAYFLVRSLHGYTQEFYLLRSGAHHFQHTLGSGAMILMVLPSHSSMPSMPGMPSIPGMTSMPAMAPASGLSTHSGTASLSVAAVVIALLLLGFALANLGRVVTTNTDASQPLLTPRLALCCQALMSMTMGYMLLML
jgi:hypothetical protein